MTKEAFLSFYPQFAIIPAPVIEEYVSQAERRFSDFEDAQEEARRLYVAHKLTLYAQTYAEATQEAPTIMSMKRLAGAGVAAQALSKSVGGVSVSKSEGSAISGISGYAEWKQTAFGMQLITLAKMTNAFKWVP